jgi:hypothetical protein
VRLKSNIGENTLTVLDLQLPIADGDCGGAVGDGDAGFAGLLAYWKWDTLIYVEHLAVSPEHRGQGIGHAVLDMLPGTVILEIEPVEDSATARRLAFYESCGFMRLPQPHVQLAYQAGEEDIPLWLLSRPAVEPELVEHFEALFHAGPMRYRDSA